jgi:hypothetical protein
MLRPRSSEPRPWRLIVPLTRPPITGCRKRGKERAAQPRHHAKVKGRMIGQPQSPSEERLCEPGMEFAMSDLEFFSLPLA